MANEQENEIIKTEQLRQEYLERLAQEKIAENDARLEELKEREAAEELAAKADFQKHKFEEEVFGALQNNSIDNYVVIYKSLNNETVVLYGHNEYESAIIAKFAYQNLKNKVLSRITD